MRRSALRAAALTAAALITMPLAAQGHRHPTGGAAHDRHAPAARPVTLLPGLGTWHHAVTTRVPRA